MSTLTVSKRVDLVRSRNKPQRPATGKRRRGDKDRATTTVWKKMLMDVCDQCSLHGLNHIVNEDRSTGERSVTVFGAHVAVDILPYASRTQQGLFFVRSFQLFGQAKHKMPYN